MLEQATQSRFQYGILEIAKQQSIDVGEADLRRLRRQFSSLKNTFIHFEVKDEFIAALRDSMPNGTEEAQVQQEEAKVAATVDLLRKHKAANNETQGEIGAIIADISSALEKFNQRKLALEDAMIILQSDLDKTDADIGPMPELPAGPNIAGCEAALEAAAAETRNLEARAAQYASVAAEAERAIASERMEIELLKSQLAQLESHSPDTQGQDGGLDRFAAAAKWCEEAARLVSALSGVAVDEDSSTSDKLILQLSTAYGASSKVSHQLVLSSTGNGAALVHAELTPSDVDISDIITIARNDKKGLECVVQEIQSRLTSFYHRSALVTQAQAQFPGSTGLHGMAGIKAPVLVGTEVEVRFVTCWPDSEDELRVVSVHGMSNESAVDRIKATRFTGKTLVQVLEAVRQELQQQ